MTEFIKILQCFIVISKISGLLSFCYAFETNGLYWNMTSTYALFLEAIRTFVLLISSYKILITTPLSYLLKFNLLKYWTIHISARLSEKWIIKFVNSIMEFDRKLQALDALMPATYSHPLKKRFWTLVTIGTVLYLVGFRIYFIQSNPVEFIEHTELLSMIFSSPDIIIFVIMITSCFFLYHLGCRYDSLNIQWENLHSVLNSKPNQWSRAEIAVFAECTRLLHAELSEVLKLFSRGYGPMLLFYFTFTFTHTIFDTFIIVMVKNLKVDFGIVPFVFYIQHLINMSTILYASSWAIQKVKMFMSQVSIYESNESTAFGFFNFNTKIIITMMSLLIAVLSTLVQMREHSNFIYLINEFDQSL